MSDDAVKPSDRMHSADENGASSAVGTLDEATLDALLIARLRSLSSSPAKRRTVRLDTRDLSQLSVAEKQVLLVLLTDKNDEAL
ncbi:MAG: hypothetical protein OHK0029_07290 [Armatimonadaceae bacterium]